MHYGEVFHLWSFSTTAKGEISAYELYRNHAGDHDLKALIDDMIGHMKKETHECDELLKDAGITPAPSLPARPKVRLEDIPAGARLTDMEIAAAVSMQIAAGLVACSAIIGSSIREDIGVLFGKYHAAKAVFAARSLRMNKEKGWLVPPPLQLEKHEPVNA